MAKWEIVGVLAIKTIMIAAVAEYIVELVECLVHPAFNLWG